MDGAFVSKAIVTDCVIDASANSRLTGWSLIVDDLSKKKRAHPQGAVMDGVMQLCQILKGRKKKSGSQDVRNNCRVSL